MRDSLLIFRSAYDLYKTRALAEELRKFLRRNGISNTTVAVDMQDSSHKKLQLSIKDENEQALVVRINTPIDTQSNVELLLIKKEKFSTIKLNNKTGYAKIGRKEKLPQVGTLIGTLSVTVQKDSSGNTYAFDFSHDKKNEILKLLQPHLLHDDLQRLPDDWEEQISKFLQPSNADSSSEKSQGEPLISMEELEDLVMKEQENEKKEQENEEKEHLIGLESFMDILPEYSLQFDENDEIDERAKGKAVAQGGGHADRVFSSEQHNSQDSLFRAGSYNSVMNVQFQTRDAMVDANNEKFRKLFIDFVRKVYYEMTLMAGNDSIGRVIRESAERRLLIYSQEVSQTFYTFLVNRNIDAVQIPGQYQMNTATHTVKIEGQYRQSTPGVYNLFCGVFFDERRTFFQRTIMLMTGGVVRPLEDIVNTIEQTAPGDPPFAPTIPSWRLCFTLLEAQEAGE